MEAWVVFSLAAAAAQTVRFMLQKRVAMGALGATGATFARFVFAAPVLLVGAAAYLAATGDAWPRMSPEFWGYALSGGIAQILATVAVVRLFALRNFAVGMTLKKSEVILTGLVGVALLGDRVSPAGWGALGLGAVGVVLLSERPGTTGPLAGRLWNPAAGLGLLSGLLFAVSAVCYRGATLALGTDDLVLRAGWTLAMVTLAQSVLMALWLGLREPGQLGAVFRSWRTAGLIGLFSLIGSFCWFAAFSLETAALVFAVGQIELVFSVLVSARVFGERIAPREAVGVAVVCVSVIAVALVG